MTLREFLKEASYYKGTYDYTFTIAISHKDEHTPFYHYRYHQTPIRASWEWLDGKFTDEYIVINPNSCPIDISGLWQRWFNMIPKRLRCAIIVKLEDMKLQYPNDEQFNDMLKWYDEKAKEYLEKVQK